MGRRPLETDCIEKTATQSVGVRLPGVAAPTHEPLVDLRKGNPARCIFLLHSPDPATEPPDISIFVPFGEW